MHHITKTILNQGGLALGAWNMLPHPNVAELMAGEAFDWICVDMEHSSHSLENLENVARAVLPRGKDLLVRLPTCDEVAAKHVLDLGATGIIVPCVNTREQAEKSVAIAHYPPQGIRGTSLVRATDYGRNFKDYFSSHNDRVVVAVMLEHIDAVNNVDEILSVPGIDASFIGPYDLSASMGLAGQLEHPDVVAAQKTLLEASLRHGVAPGMHVVPQDPDLVRRRIDEGYRFLALGLDTEFILSGSRAMLSGVPPSARNGENDGDHA